MYSKIRYHSKWQTLSKSHELVHILDLEDLQTSQGYCQHKDNLQSAMEVVGKNTLLFKYCLYAVLKDRCYSFSPHRKYQDWIWDCVVIQAQAEEYRDYRTPEYLQGACWVQMDPNRFPRERSKNICGIYE